MKTVSSLRCPITPKRKRPLLAGLLGLVFGALGTLYFGWKVCLTTVIVVLGSTIVVAWAMPFPCPEWYMWLVSIFFAFWNYALALGYNEAMEREDETFSLATLNLVGMQGWYIRFLAVTMGLYSGIMLAREERWLAALGVVFILTPLTIWFFESTVGLVLFLLGPLFALTKSEPASCESTGETEEPCDVCNCEDEETHKSSSDGKEEHSCLAQFANAARFRPLDGK